MTALLHNSRGGVAQQHRCTAQVSSGDLPIPEKDLLHTGGSRQKGCLLFRRKHQAVYDFFHTKTSLFCQAAEGVIGSCFRQENFPAG